MNEHEGGGPQTSGTVARVPMGVHASYGEVPVPYSALQGQLQRLPDIARHDEPLGLPLSR